MARPHTTLLTMASLAGLALGGCALDGDGEAPERAMHRLPISGGWSQGLLPARSGLSDSRSDGRAAELAAGAGHLCDRDPHVRHAMHDLHRERSTLHHLLSLSARAPVRAGRRSDPRQSCVRCRLLGGAEATLCELSGPS